MDPRAVGSPALVASMIQACGTIGKRQVWQKARGASLTPEQLASPLMRRPYDLRHSGITWRLNSGVPATEVAAWAGHSVEVLMRVYARCVVGLEDVWIGRMDMALHLGQDQ